VAAKTCPTPTGFWIDRTTGERRSRPCRRLRCPYCGPRLALSTANAIVLATPHSSAVITTWGPAVPRDPEQLFRVFVRAVNVIAYDLRSEGREWEYCWTLELSETRIPNAHVLQWGSTVSGARFRRSAIDAGMKWGDLQPIRHLPILARYTLKLPLAPLDLGLDGEACMSLHLALNGGRLVRSSRRFWRNGAHETLSGLREARVAARRAHRPGRRPTPEELAEWRGGWKLPGLDAPGP
jgi:hypothetical protein